jgi:adenosylcobyric acid synthase
MIQGYEIRMGETESQSQWLEIVSRNGEQVKLMDGSISSNGKVWGCYLHGLIANDTFRQAWLTRLGWRGQVTSQAARFEESLDKLADTVESALNMELLEKIIWTS